MKKFASLILLLIFTSITIAQNKEIKKIEKIGKDLYEVSIYYENGNLMQHGFLSKNDKLHAQWDSYNEDGSKKCVGFYNNGIKVGTWFYWDKNIGKRVTYQNNKIVNVEELENTEDKILKEQDLKSEH